MKKNYFLTLIFFISLIHVSNAQLSEVISGITNPSGLATDGNTLYISDRNDDKVFKIDLSQENPTPIDVVTQGLIDPTALAIYNSELYIADTNGNKILKLNLEEANPVATTVTTDVSRPADIIIVDNTLYIADTDGNRVSKIDLTQSTVIVEEIISVFAPFRLASDGNDLYALTDVDLIKVNEAEGTFEVIANANDISFTSSALTIREGILYTSYSTGNDDLETIFQFDLSSNPITSKDLLSGAESYTRDFAFDGSTLYTCNSLQGIIYKVDIEDIPQTATDIRQFGSSQDIISYQDHFYVSEEFNNGISKLSIENGIPSIELAVDLFSVRQLTIKDNELYFTTDSGIWKADLTEEILPIVPEQVVTSNNLAWGIVIEGNYLYYSNFTGGDVNKFDLTTNTIVQVFSGLDSPAGIAIKDDELFVTEYFSDRISKFNINEASPSIIPVVTNVNRPFELTIKDNDLYFADTVLNKVYKKDILSSGSEIITVVNEATRVNGLHFVDEILYIVEENKLSFFDTADPLSITESSFDNNVSLFPNPTEKFLTLKNLKAYSSYSIFNNIGQVVKSGIIESNNSIDIEELTIGLYYLELNNTETLKFIKR